MRGAALEATDDCKVVGSLNFKTLAGERSTYVVKVSLSRPKGGKGESLESRKQKAQEWKGRARRGAQARRAAPDL